MGNSLFWALCRCINHLCCPEVRFYTMVMTAWEIQGEQGRGDPPRGYRIQGGQLKGQEGQGAEHIDPGRLGLTAVSIKIPQIINFFFFKCSLKDMDWGIRIVQEMCWVPGRVKQSFEVLCLSWWASAPPSGFACALRDLPIQGLSQIAAAIAVVPGSSLKL